MNKSLTQHILESKNGRLCYYTNTLHTNKETILMLHPAFGNHKLFNAQIDAFENDYNLVLLDLPGHGNSVHEKSKLNLSMVPSIIQKILQKHNIQKAHILGVSIGSLIGQGFADQYPHMTKTVTVVGGYSIHCDNAKVMKSQKSEMFKWLFYIIFNMNAFRRYIVDASSYSSECKKIMTASAAKFKRSHFMYMNGMNKIIRKTDEKKNYPLLAIVGEHDLDIAIDSAKVIGKMDNGRYKLIKNAGHCANVDSPEEFNMIYKEFING